MKLYLDMDGVVADFMGMLAKHGHVRDGHWPDEELWPVVKSIPDFWSDMPTMPDAKVLWSAVKHLKPTFLTAPARSDPRCKPGKRQFISKHFGKVPVIFSRARDKQNYAEPDAILVDDNAKNIREWKAKGGIGILHTSAASTIRKLNAVLNSVSSMAVGETFVVRSFKEDMAPQVILLMGLPAAGKSTFVSKELTKYYNHRMPHMGAFQVLNSDTQLKKHQYQQAVNDFKKLTGTPESRWDEITSTMSYKSNDGNTVPFKLSYEEFKAFDGFNDFWRAMYKPYYATFFGGRDAAKRDTDALADKKIKSGDVTILDSTGTNAKKMLDLFQRAKEAGSTTSVVWLDIPVEYSIARDQYRGETEGRSVGDGVIRSYVPKLGQAYKTYMQSDLVDRLLHFRWHGGVVKGQYKLVKDFKKYPRRG